MNLYQLILRRIAMVSTVIFFTSVATSIILGILYLWDDHFSPYNIHMLMMIGVSLITLMASSQHITDLIDQHLQIHTRHWIVKLSSGETVFQESQERSGAYGFVFILLPFVTTAFLAAGATTIGLVMLAFLAVGIIGSAVIEKEEIANIEQALTEGTQIPAGNKRKPLEDGSYVLEIETLDDSEPLWLPDTPERRKALYDYRVACIGKTEKDAPAPYTEAVLA